MLASSIMLSVRIICLHALAIATSAKNFPAQLKEHCSNNPAGPLRPLAHHTTCPPLVDDDTFVPSNPGPWSYPPTCVIAASRTNWAPSSKKEKKLCAYTASSIRGGSALSVITTTEIAASMSAMLLDPDIAWLEKQRGGVSLTDFRAEAHKVQRITGKGLGVVATEKIRRGQVVMVEQPVMVQLADWEPLGWKKSEVVRLLREGAAKLPPRERKRLFQMAHRGMGDIVDDVVRTNAYQAFVDGVEHSALYPEVARINHACKPNCIIRHSSTTLIMEVVAYTDISPGEELSVSYVPLNLVSDQRSSMLKGQWGFNCTCPLCSDAKASTASDDNRNRVADILKMLGGGSGLSSGALRAAVAEMEDLVAEEGMAAQIGDLYGIVADVCLTMGNLGMARELAEQTLDVQRWYAGVDNERTTKALEFWQEVNEMKPV
ncbi:hypothetical protein B0H63DRAFT_487371 [Podospora didyma]|uniref:SET domain-containing protein n=1 Tax=Podospora didyma TaxID=330526 RepID=A0AAE0K6B0_9PEZI|nr:hypothetical protein B0H63DRAFT_487371 [Podospora didyma]